MTETELAIADLLHRLHADDPARLRSETLINDDLGVAGDDGLDLLLALRDRFKIEIYDFDLGRYFGSESANIAGHVKELIRGEYRGLEPLSIKQLAEYVDSKVRDKPNSVDEIKSTIRTWYASKSMVEIDVSENDSPVTGNGDDYEGKWEIILSPRSAEKPYLTIFLTPTGSIAVGIETWPRVASRVGLRCLGDSKLRLVGGFEPLYVTIPVLLGLCDLVAEARIKIVTYSWRGWLLGCDLRCLEGSHDPLIRSLSGELSLLKFLSRIGLIRSLDLEYAAWRQ